jgi:hypothetical protein
MTPTYITQRAVRVAFWDTHPNLLRRPGRQNAQPTNTRIAFCDFVDMLAREGHISEALASRVTL